MTLRDRLQSIDISRFGRVGLLLGGQSAEREISLQSGAAVKDALERLGIEHVVIDPTHKLASQLTNASIDRAFIALHGRGGEDGSLQGMLELMNIPYTGSRVLASALAMDKSMTKKVWRADGLRTADWVALSAQSNFEQLIERLGGRVMVKPAHEGSSLGMSIASNAGELHNAFVQASKFDTSVIAESWLPGPEFTVPVLFDTALPLIQLGCDDIFYTYEAKYLSERTQYLCPAPVSAGMAEEIADLAKQAFRSLGCSGWGRIDIMLDADSRPVLLEANTVPGLTSHSLVPMAAKQAGLSFDELVLLILSSTGAGA